MKKVSLLFFALLISGFSTLLTQAEYRRDRVIVYFRDGVMNKVLLKLNV